LTLGAALLVGKIIRVKVRWIQSLFLPSSIVAGTILLLLGPQVLGRFDGPLKGRGLFTQAMSTTWSALPGLLISHETADDNGSPQQFWLSADDDGHPIDVYDSHPLPRRMTGFQYEIGGNRKLTDFAAHTVGAEIFFCHVILRCYRYRIGI